MTETPTAAPATMEEVTAAYEALRQAQAAQRVMVAQAAWSLGRDEACSLCSDGINDWLRDNGIPAIPDTEDEDATFDPEAAHTAALQLIPGLQNVEWFTPVGLQRQVTEREQAGTDWVNGVIRNLQGVQRNYPRDISANRVNRLIRQLRGEPEPEPAAGSAPAAGMTHIVMNAALTLQVPTARINGATHQQIIAAAEGTIGNAIRTAVANSQYGARIADGTEIRTTVQHG